ncbi:DUF2252 domain-containing protein [Demequina sp. SYSU T00039]|uniref:DUF2252 domain-containing protein n=1 Tax=Demequina lignilytica TaxID=3051663 RepID=A0AAW7M864_9MICO|nr:MULTISPECIES: DUF2252 domain-containing protein [unclassified Demequina]MDN4486756.1 DUF2252 domain-containing protein [Demequina sp. SYSU T00039]MDN4489440.1 DUF2252 domain-containing protein [Demequina sp. SYSU T00068]
MTTRPDLAMTLDAQLSAGRALRRSVARRQHALLEMPDRDPVAILEAQHRGRVPELVPVRVARMLESPFAFYRGSAAHMAHDLRDAPRTGIVVVACGDAHLGNFGFYASPERELVFDLNDFDEANVGPWEWDLKRLATSAVLAGREVGIDERTCREAATAAAHAYRDTLNRLYAHTALERFYFRVEADALLDRIDAGPDRKELRRAQRKARRRSSEQVLTSVATVGSGLDTRIVDQPPVLRHLGVASPEQMTGILRTYRESAASDVAVLLEQYTLVDAAFRVVGVGSVGLRAHIALLIGPSGEPLMLQPKEAVPSVLVTYGGMAFGDTRRRAVARPSRGVEGWRVVTGQRVMQAVSDRFLGWLEFEGRDFYVRQFRDMKGAVDLDRLTPSLLVEYTRLCAAVLARAHAQSPDGARILGYLGRSDRFDDAVARWARDYADQAERDHAALAAAVRSGRLAAVAT